MSALADFASLSLADLTAEIVAMQKTFPLATAGTFSTVTSSRQDDPSPADTAARGTYFEGLYADGKRNGPGMMTTSAGAWFQGIWRDGRINGEGRWRRPNGDVYAGNWRDNRPDGEGTLTLKSGERYTGIWVHGCLTLADRQIPFPSPATKCEAPAAP